MSWPHTFDPPTPRLDVGAVHHLLAELALLAIPVDGTCTT
jgi:hypothetical protein